MDNVVGTLAWKVCGSKLSRFISENVDEKSKRYTAPMNGALYNLLSLIKYLSKGENVSDTESLGLGNGMIHSFAANYDVDGEIAKFQSEDPEELALYKEAFTRGFEAGILTHSSVDVLMRKGLGFENYQPIIITEDEL
ncbi:hypothetical protein MTBPR1_200025 [Candidatus Terasakiella magnetica]|uniref:Uncharacterized protein n=1 Tax=Candidatus Terasakiella magnetica TaxID=1867952 RepID=A0A1C3RGY9_9PROT|nr:hypothetical protein [Candidatus Terasakiella magnetica]SCA56545.1 hypothetical protein MTBPR1_200025 [Candidatus Terasakiella magnetica]